MRVGNYELNIHPGRESREGYVELAHNTQYILALHNRHRTRCDAEITIDGKDMGSFRIDPLDSIRLERGLNDTGRFTFYKRDSAEGQQSELGSVAHGELGLITVRFRPEFEPRPKAMPLVKRSPYSSTLNWRDGDGPPGSVLRTSSLSSAQSRGMEAGGTGLSGHSDQSFYTVADLNYDPSKEVVINLRLVCQAHEYPIHAARPMKPVSNPVPAPLY